MIERAHAQGGYGVIGQDAGYSPGFFQGMSGIGYALLRQAYPDRLPEVLLWD
jgi:lantibiotic modifying enzyme